MRSLLVLSLFAVGCGLEPVAQGELSTDEEAARSADVDDAPDAGCSAPPKRACMDVGRPCRVDSDCCSFADGHIAHTYCLHLLGGFTCAAY